MVGFKSRIERTLRTFTFSFYIYLTRGNKASLPSPQFSRPITFHIYLTRGNKASLPSPLVKQISLHIFYALKSLAEFSLKPWQIVQKIVIILFAGYGDLPDDLQWFSIDFTLHF